MSGVRTSAGTIACEQVVVAAGPWSAALDPAGDGPPVRPVKGQILELRTRGAMPEPFERVLRTPRCYLVARGDGRVVLGATVEEQGFDTAVTADGVFRLLEAAWEVLPEVGELELVGAHAGLRPGTPDNAPVVGPGELDGLIWATGHWRNGVLLAPLTGEVVAGLLAGEPLPEDFAALSPSRFGGARMTIVMLNGERRELDGRATVAAAVELAGAPEGGRGVAVALDGEVVPRGEWATTEVRDGQELEVLRAVQGGA